jgi:hypothetical protein
MQLEENGKKTWHCCMAPFSFIFSMKKSCGGKKWPGSRCDLAGREKRGHMHSVHFPDSGLLAKQHMMCDARQTTYTNAGRFYIYTQPAQECLPLSSAMPLRPPLPQVEK